MKVPSNIVFLTGFMAVGKSYWADILSKELNIEHLDIDDAIESMEERSIAQIIKAEGEEAFRDMESNLLRSCVDKMTKGIISLGGGTLLKEANLKFVRQKGILIWLKKDSLEIMDDSEQGKRPLYRKEQLPSLYNERKLGYSKADFVVNLDNFEEQQEVKQRLIKIIRRSLNL